MVLMLVACGESTPPEPTPIGQVCETRFSGYIPILSGKTMVMVPQYRTECWIEEQGESHE